MTNAFIFLRGISSSSLLVAPWILLLSPQAYLCPAAPSLPVGLIFTLGPQARYSVLPAGPLPFSRNIPPGSSELGRIDGRTWTQTHTHTQPAPTALPHSCLQNTVTLAELIRRAKEEVWPCLRAEGSIQASGSGGKVHTQKGPTNNRCAVLLTACVAHPESVP